MKAKNTVSDTPAAQRNNVADVVISRLWLPLIFGASLICSGNPVHAAQQQGAGKPSMQSGSNAGARPMQAGGVTRSQSVRPRNVIGSPPVPPGNAAGGHAMPSKSGAGTQAMRPGGAGGGDQNPGRGTKPPTDYTGTRSSQEAQTMEQGGSATAHEMKTGMGNGSGSTSNSGAATGTGSGTGGETGPDTQPMDQGSSPDLQKGASPNPD